MTDMLKDLAEVVRLLQSADSKSWPDDQADWEDFNSTAADFFRTHAAEIEAMARENEVLRNERSFERKKFDQAVKVLSSIHAVIYPRIFDVNGQRYAFHSPIIHEQMQALSDRIRAIPGEIAAMRSAKEDGE